ncbi:hypothetical protein AN219_05065 [Streptomyces nanshensis]|nr:hypothetical protein AN219_05065 [Streptomyces nanshensis]
MAVNGEPAVVVYVWLVDATPPDSGTTTVGLPSPKSNVTVPVGVPAPGATGATVAVNVTGSPTTDGSGTSVRAVVVSATSTVCVSPGGEVEAAKLTLPL